MSDRTKPWLSLSMDLNTSQHSPNIALHTYFNENIERRQSKASPVAEITHGSGYGKTRQKNDAFVCVASFCEFFKNTKPFETNGRV